MSDRERRAHGWMHQQVQSTVESENAWKRSKLLIGTSQVTRSIHPCNNVKFDVLLLCTSILLYLVTGCSFLTGIDSRCGMEKST